MAAAATATDIEKFLAGPLVKWLSHCVKKADFLQVYETFFDGTAINEVLLQIDPEPSVPVPTIGNLQDHRQITTARIKIFYCIIKNIKIIYEEELGQIIINLPDCVTLGRKPTSQAALNQLELLILLLLGCAVQCPNKELFINKIKELELDLQHDIVECIKQVTDGQNLVITADIVANNQSSSPEKLFAYVRKLINQRDVLLQQLISDLGQQEEKSKISGNGTDNDDGGTLVSLSTTSSGIPTSSSGVGNDGSIESHHWAVELADWKAKLRKHRQELEEKTETLAEYKEDLEHANNQISKLKTENSDLTTEARKAKIYQDELDAMRERAERADRLELEIQKFRERLCDAEFYKVRVDELREDNRILLETREMLEEQLVTMRQRTNHILELESELLTSKKTINEIMLERDSARDKIHDLYEENLQLQQLIKVSLQEKKMENLLAAAAAAEAEASANAEDLDGTYNSMGDNSLSEQLINNAQTRALKLELENRRLLNTIDTLKEANFHENSTKILELEKEKKKLLLKCEQLQENCERFSQQNVELENLFKNAIQENKKLQSTLDSQKIVSDRQSQDLQNEKLKIMAMEKNIDGLTKEKQRIQSLCDIVKKRADDADNCLNQMSEQLQSLQIEVEKGRQTEKLNTELNETISQLEKENSLLQKEVTKFKETIEIKDVNLDKNIEEKLQQEKEIQKLHQETICLHSQVEKLQEFEQKATELVSQASIHVETINTLQKDLVNEKVSNEKLKSNLDRLGLSLDILDNDVNVVVEKMLENSDISKHIYSIFIEKQDDFCPKHSASLNTNNNNAAQQQRDDVDVLQNENATLKVDLSTLKSQMHSLQAQQTVLQLANSQLVAEKDELSKLRQIQSDKQGALLEDQKIFRKLHEQLNNEYEQLKIDQENLKKTIRDLRSEIRTLKEKNNNLEMKISSGEIEKETLRNDTRNLNNLRIEHSKLKDDFRNLFTASERLKVEYRNIQDEIKNLKMESRNFRLRETEIQGELTTRSDTVTILHLDNAKLHQKCDMLFEMNHSLDADRRALMDHVSQLLTQYHSLLTHSLEDKQQYHLEEKLFSDKLNNLCRQKEKLEEKIMEHYKKLDSVSSKKKGFGSTLVKRVRKAGSDFINKVPTPSRNHRRSWHEESSQFTLPDSQQHGSAHDSDNNNDPTTATEDFGSFKRNTIATGSGHSGYKLRGDDVPLRKSLRESRSSSIAGDEIYGGSGTSKNVETPPAPPGSSALSLGSVGSRRTVYLSEDDSGPIACHASTSSLSNPSSNVPPATNTPLLVYNRISTVIGGTGSNGGDSSLRNSYSLPQQHYPSTTPPPPPPAAPPSSSVAAANSLSTAPNNNNNNNNDKKEKNSKETAIWYEYGCV